MVTTASDLVPSVLEEYGRATREAMLAYLGPPGHQDHFSELIADYPTRAGRSLRASLCLATAKMFALLMGIKTAPDDNKRNQGIQSNTKIQYM